MSGAGERIRFDWKLSGHVVLLNLMKRFRCVTTQLHPEQLEAGFDDTWQNMWNKLADKALGRHVTMEEATARDMSTMARYLAAAIGEHPCRYAYYPLGWEPMAERARENSTKFQHQRLDAKVRKRLDEQPHDHTNFGEAALTFVAMSKKMSKEAVLESLGLSRPIGNADESTILGLMR